MFPYLLIVFLVVGLALSCFLIFLLFSSSRKCSFCIDDDQTVEIVKFVEAHRENLPISSVQGWCLVSCHSGLRCWKKDLPFTLIGCPIKVYGCTRKINCSAISLLNVIADVSTWPEWDIWSQEQTVHLEVPEDPCLHGDLYMQCDQLIVTTTMVKTKPDIVMYRFGNLENNGVGWILLWNAKQLEWTFYLAQPMDECSNGSESICMLTVIWGIGQCYSFHKNVPEELCTKVQNLSDAIVNSHLKVRPFQPLMQSSSTLNNPHFPTIHSALSDLPDSPCVLLQLERNKHINILQKSCVLAVAPISTEKPANVANLSGFLLISRLLKKPELINSAHKEPLVSEEKRRSRRRQKVRSDSLTSSIPISKQLDMETRRSSSLSAPVVRRKPPELTVTQPEEEQKSPTRASSHSFLDLLFHRRRSSDASSGKRSRSPSVSRSSSPPRERKKKKEGKKTLSYSSSQEDISKNLAQGTYIASETAAVDHSDCEKDFSESEYHDQHKSFVNSEGVNHSLLLISDRGEQLDYKTIGDHCVSILLKENFKASMIDINTSEEEQKKVTGGWTFKELNKDVTVLKRTSLLTSCNVLSYLCRGIIPSSSPLVWKTLCNPLTRFMYDDTVKKISVLQDFSSGQKLIHMYNESVTLLKKEVQDFCLLQTEREEGNHLVLAFHSVHDKICPPLKDITRGTVISSGWVVESIPESPSLSMVTYLMQMVVSSPEIQLMEDISNIQSQCINNLSVYLATRPPC